MDSGVIYLVVVGLWGAAVVPHLVRRREQLAASRAGDRSSAAMRVLGRRPDAPSTVPQRETTRAYVLAPAARRRAAALAAQGIGTPAAIPTPAASPATVTPVPATPAPATPAPPARGPRQGAAPGAGPRTAAAPRPGTWGVAAIVLTLLVVLPLAAVGLGTAALLGAAHPLLAAAPLTGFTALVVTLRGRARHRERARRSGVHPVHGRAGGVTVADRAPAAGDPAPGGTPPPARPLVIDLTDASLAATRAPSAAIAPADPDAWTPVPVPPPTYTLKPLAPRAAAPRRAAPRPAPAAAGPRVVDVTDAALGDLAAVIERRRAVGA